MFAENSTFRNPAVGQFLLTRKKDVRFGLVLPCASRALTQCERSRDSLAGDSLKLLEKDGVASSSFYQLSVVPTESFIRLA